MSRGRGPRPHSGHRSHRRRWTGPQRGHDAPVRTAQVVPLADCHPELTCTWHGTCSVCGDTIHLATMDESNGFALDQEAVARFICGDPPRCADCRSGVT